MRLELELSTRNVQAAVIRTAVSQDAETEEIKQAYRKILREYVPDGVSVIRSAQEMVLVFSDLEMQKENLLAVNLKRAAEKMKEECFGEARPEVRVGIGMIYPSITHLYKSELVKNESEIYALRSQINPHFLYNTLQCMGGIALMNDQPVVAEMAANMAEIFRYSIKEGDKVSMEEEADFLRKYLDICDVRFNGRFKWRIELEEGLESLHIDKMILQPLVENAVYHGLEKRTAPGGMLWIQGEKEGKSLIFRITDNGCGPDEEQLALRQATLENKELLEQERRARKRIGLVNIQSRLKLMYGDAGGLTFGRKEGMTIVTVKRKKPGSPC